MKSGGAAHNGVGDAGPRKDKGVQPSEEGRAFFFVLRSVSVPHTKGYSGLGTTASAKRRRGRVSFGWFQEEQELNQKGV